jgi:hypothetical protein
VMKPQRSIRSSRQRLQRAVLSFLQESDIPELHKGDIIALRLQNLAA